jgi:hypothetical protein
VVALRLKVRKAREKIHNSQHYSYVVKRAIKHVNSTKFVYLGTMNRYSTLAVTETAPLSPKQSNDDLSPKKTVVLPGYRPWQLMSFTSVLKQLGVYSRRAPPI